MLAWMALGHALVMVSLPPTWLWLVKAAFPIRLKIDVHTRDTLCEPTSITAVANTLMPVMAAAAVGLGVEPLPLLMAVALTASCAFMLRWPHRPMPSPMVLARWPCLA
jgi:hypothetical protein